MTSAPLPLHRGFGETLRRDAWWVAPLVDFLIFSAFLVYATWAAFQGTNYAFGPYLSPMYSPEVFGDSPHAWFSGKPPFWPSFIPFSAALLILPFPGLFRFTCYYYRGAYYKAFWADPPNCAVGEPRKGYRGEKLLPLVVQNVHRYFMYIAVLFLFFLWHDVWKGLWFYNGGASEQLGLGVGTLVLAVNSTLLTGYTLGCHSLRHVLGGYKDVISSPVQSACYNCASSFNGAHKTWARASLFWVMFADIYVRLCSMGIWSDWRIL